MVRIIKILPSQIISGINQYRVNSIEEFLSEIEQEKMKIGRKGALFCEIIGHYSFSYNIPYKEFYLHLIKNELSKKYDKPLEYAPGYIEKYPYNHRPLKIFIDN